jgi:glutamine amidotransferase
MDPDPGWRPMAASELVHVGPDLAVTATLPFAEAPAHPLTLSDLDAAAAESQKH